MSSSSSLNELLARGAFSQAETLLRERIAQHPDDHVAFNLLAQTLSQRGRHAEALAWATRSRELAPHATYWHTTGIIHHQLGQYAEATQAFTEASSRDPDNVTILNDLGIALAAAGRSRAALSAYRRVLEREPAHLDARYNAAKLQKTMGRIDDAYRDYREVLTRDPSYAKAANNLAVLCEGWGDTAAALTYYRQALHHDPHQYTCYSNYLLTLNRLDTITQHEILRESQRFGQLSTPPIQRRLAPRRPREHRETHTATNSQRPLRIGFLSGDFTRHSVAYFFLPLLSNLSPRECETHCFYTRADETDYTREIAAHATAFVPVASLSTAALVECLRHACLDVLVDLSGHANHNRLSALAQRVAPLQVTWLGYPNTTGLPAMDARIVDAITDPPGTEEHCTETLLRLPHCFLCYRPPDEAPEPAHPPLGERPVVFGSFNNAEKLTPTTLRLWAAILTQVPSARLIIKSVKLSTPRFAEEILTAFHRAGIEPERIDIMGAHPDTASHLAAYSQVDIALDPHPYNGTTTTCEALWMGTPVITYEGERHAARVSASLLRTLGADELRAADSADYVTRAVELAHDRPRLASYHRTLRQRMARSPLCDGPAFATHWITCIRDALNAGLGCSSPTLSSADAHAALAENNAADAPEHALRVLNELIPATALICEHDPHNTQARAHRAEVLSMAGQLDMQASLHERGLQRLEAARDCEPTRAIHHKNLGVAYHLLRRFDDALASCVHAWELGSEDADTANKVGIVLAQRERYRDALIWYGRCLDLDATPATHAEASYNSGRAYAELGEIEKSIAYYRRALHYTPRFADAHCNLAEQLKRSGDTDEAERHLLKALDSNPSHSAAHNNLAGIRQAQMNYNAARTHYRKALGADPLNLACYGNLLFLMNRSDKDDQRAIAIVAREAGACAQAKAQQEGYTPFVPPPSTSREHCPTRALRVGLVSPDFFCHSVSFFLTSFLPYLAANGIEIHAYHARAATDAVTEQIRQAVHAFTPVHHLSDSELVRCLRADELDIAIDLAGYTDHNRLEVFAHRVAPIQATWLGFPNTTGIATMDYRLVDHHSDPPGDDELYSETLVRLPGHFLCYAPPSDAPAVRATANNAIVFGSFNSADKITPATITFWSALLHAHPSSTLLLKALNSTNSHTVAWLHREFAREGIDPIRISCIPYAPRIRDHLDTYNRIDIALDTFPYQGTTTTCEALYMGTPVLSLTGTRHASRVSSSILRAVGHLDWSQTSVEGVADVAAELIADRPELQRISAGLRTELLESPLCNGMQFAAQFAATLKALNSR